MTTNSPKTTKPRSEGDKRRKGKKNKDWKKDPEILFRLNRVSELMAQKKNAPEIAQETKVSLATVFRDMERVAEQMKDRLDVTIKNTLDLSLEQYNNQIRQGWADALSLPVTHPSRVASLRLALSAQQAIDKITGIGSDRVEHSGPNGGPIPVEVQDIKKVQEKRLKELAPMLADLLKQENNAAQPADAEKS